MGIFMFLGLCTLLAAKMLLLSKIVWTKDCTGVSGKTQVLYAIIFAGRYLDIVSSFYTCALGVFFSRLTFTALAYCIVLSIYFFYSGSYQGKYDTFRIELLILPCLVLSLLANYRFDIVEVFWAFSVYLESVAIIPQLYFISRAKHVENAVYYYIALLSWYKVFHLVEGVYRFYSNEPYDRISLAAGVVQLMFYCDFFMRDVPLKGDVRGEVDEEAGGVSQEDKDRDDRRKAKEEEAMRSAAEYLQQQEQQEQQQVENENEAEKHNNLREVVLTPAALMSEDEKLTVVTPAQKEGKQLNETAITV